MSEAQDRANVSVALSHPHMCLRCQHLEPVPSVQLWMYTCQLLLVSHPLVGTVCAAPAFPLCLKSVATGEDMDCPVTGR